MVEIIAKYQIIAIYVFSWSKFEGDTVLIFVLVVRREVEIR
jgi:hypothetical protein